MAKLVINVKRVKRQGKKEYFVSFTISRRLSPAQYKMISRLAAVQSEAYWGYKLSKGLGIQPDTAYTFLKLLKHHELVEMKPIDFEGKERKVFFLTEEGLAFAEWAIENHQAEDYQEDAEQELNKIISHQEDA